MTAEHQGTDGTKGTIVLIHGLWMTPHSWQGWIDRYTAAGYRVLAPAWPGVSALEEERDPDRAPSDIGMGQVADHYEASEKGLTRGVGVHEGHAAFGDHGCC